MKSLFRYVFAALLATTVYYYSNGTESNYQASIETQLLEDEYELVDDTNPHFPLKGSRSVIEPKCPSGDQICAVNTADGLDIIEWHGGTTKF